MDGGLYHIHYAIQICMVLFSWFCVLKPILFSPSMSVKNHASMAPRHPSSSSCALRSRADSPRRRHAVRPVLLRPRGQPRQSSAMATMSLGAAGGRSSLGG
ncbi:unnamed protein product, partial [Vitis vinifera]|uniref:Uncharacterized protein n=1 Tax=Vitis vinifera TaxID=29760 RepID=D7SQI4_VITVI